MAASASPAAAAAADELADYLEHHHGLSITRSPSKGRCLVALRSFRRGDHILHQEPYVATLDAASQGSRCDRCYRPSQSSSLKRCSACKTVFYCSADCQVPPLYPSVPPFPSLPLAIIFTFLPAPNYIMFPLFSFFVFAICCRRGGNGGITNLNVEYW